MAFLRAPNVTHVSSNLSDVFGFRHYTYHATKWRSACAYPIIALTIYYCFWHYIWFPDYWLLLFYQIKVWRGEVTIEYYHMIIYKHRYWYFMLHTYHMSMHSMEIVWFNLTINTCSLVHGHTKHCGCHYTMSVAIVKHWNKPTGFFKKNTDIPIS